ncbi:hypothetical protein [Rhizorhabdus sp. FW153]|uniref:hypothetical protein n=1 Tax=Rhizorhabdus sp. FW153 TaxID=3400216 RepID=UPI003CF16280
MTLRRPKDMRTYFKDIQGRADGGARFETDFDQFYLCLMVGLDDGRLAPESELEPAEFNKGYTAPYKPFAPVIAGMLVEAEMRRQGIPTTKEAIQREIRNLIEVGNGGTQLKEEGTKLLSRYAARGFELIREEIPKPRTLEDFLVAYYQRWKPAEDGTAQPASDEDETTAAPPAS